jgi:transcriptional regulator with XRE-family HTH domain
VGMDIKSQLIEILKKENYTFSQLADYLSMSENDLITDLNNKTLDLRVLELISKELRVPLYSFFRSENAKVDTYKKPYYVNKLWTSDDSIKKASKLKNEINLLKHIISLKEEQLKKIPS